MLGTPCAKAQSRDQASVLWEKSPASMAGEEGERGERGTDHPGGPLEVPAKALEFPWSRVDGNLERVKQEAGMV